MKCPYARTAAVEEAVSVVGAMVSPDGGRQTRYVIVYLDGRPAGRGATRRPQSVGQAERPAADRIEVGFGESARPGRFVVFGGEVVGRFTDAEALGDRSRIGGVLLAHRGGGNVHDISPALLVGDRFDAVDHVAVPP